jgi:hypothetical protein
MPRRVPRCAGPCFSQPRSPILIPILMQIKNKITCDIDHRIVKALRKFCINSASIYPEHSAPPEFFQTWMGDIHWEWLPSGYAGVVALKQVDRFLERVVSTHPNPAITLICRTCEKDRQDGVKKASRKQEVTDKASADFEVTQIEGGEQIEEEQSSCRLRESVLTWPARYRKRQQANPPTRHTATPPSERSAPKSTLTTRVGLRLKATPVATSRPAASVTEFSLSSHVPNSAQVDLRLQQGGARQTHLPNEI